MTADVWTLWLLVTSTALVSIGGLALVWPRKPDRRWIHRLRRIERGRRAMATPTRAAFKARARS